MRGAIEFDHVWFAYKGEDYVLRDVSFTVDPGEKVAIVGATGSGKTTIIKLLKRFYDVSRGAHPGRRRRRPRVGPAGAAPPHRRRAAGRLPVHRRRRRQHLARPPRGDAGDDRGRRATGERRSFIRALPGGVHERLRERGTNLSTGQRQLLAFARALAYDPAILVLDEATSSVDTETEMLIQDALDTLMRDRTALVIAHRLSTIEHSDRIIVLHHGEIREIGTHLELVAARGIYHRLYELQYALADELGAAARWRAERAGAGCAGACCDGVDTVAAAWLLAATLGWLLADATCCAPATRRRRSSGAASRSTTVLARPDLEPDIRRKLELVLDVRRFAAEHRA